MVTASILILSTLSFVAIAQNSTTTTTSPSNLGGSNYSQNNFQAPKNFIHGIKINLNGTDYYSEGPADAQNGARDA